MTEILHVIGLCPDTHSHFDVLDLFLCGGGIGYFLYTVKLYFKVSYNMLKEYINKL
jgi:hypothetical protein